MNFLAPTAFIFAAALPVVILFYLLKRKRVVRLVSSTLLWQKFLAETQASAPFQRLRHNWLLILQLLLLTLAVFALARPFFASDIRSSRMRVLILDASASMQSTDESPSRFEKARAEALKWVDSLRDHDQMLVLVAGAHTEVKQSATSNKAALRRAIESAEITDATTRLKEALKMAESLIKNRGDAEIHLFTDGAVKDLEDSGEKAAQIVYHQIGKTGNNVGIVTLDVRANPQNAAQRALYTSIVNYSSNQHQLSLELQFEKQSLEVRPITLAPGETSREIFLANQDKNGVFTISINPKDDLAADNRASVLSLLPVPLKILLVTRGNRFLEKALRAGGTIDLRLASELSTDAKQFDLVVLDNVSPSTWPEVNTLAFNVVNTNWFDRWSRLEAPAIVDWKNTHPLLRYVGFDNVQISESLKVSSPSWGISLVDSAQSPLIVAGEVSRQRLVWIGFDPLQSTWPLRISFPIFIANAVEWLNPASVKAAEIGLRPGEPFRFSVTENLKSAEVQLPDGKTKPVFLDPSSREIIFGETHKQGIYQLSAGTNNTRFCVNLLSSEESQTQPQADLKLGKYGKVSASRPERANMEIWRWIAAAAVAVLMFEWWYYHKRTA